MNYLCDAKQMKEIDDYSINKIGIPSMVLMERAALSVSSRITNPKKTLVVCGYGNNGADGLAVARQLKERNLFVDILAIGCEDKKTPEFKMQSNILSSIGLEISNNVQLKEYDCIVDAIFGIGLKREVTGEFALWIEKINSYKRVNPEVLIISVDIPSGLNASDGSVCGCCIKADTTVTFGRNKLGLVLFPGRDMAGNVYVADVGFFYNNTGDAFSFDKSDLSMIPKRENSVNKGNCGKILIVAGSKDMAGAAAMSALAAFRSGAGLVRVLTHKDNRNVILSIVPEAIVDTYEDAKQLDSDYLKKSVNWSDCVILGPGISVDEGAAYLVSSLINIFTLESNNCLNVNTKALILDADALNIISFNENIKSKVAEINKKSGVTLYLTPHIGEAARLTGENTETIKCCPVETAKKLAGELSAVCVLKDAATVVSDGEKVYINVSGNCGMATAGTGDILTGILAGMATCGIENVLYAAALAVYVHGIAGDYCKENKGARSMKACDIAEALPFVFE